jgi:hypothetical protein
MQSQQSTSHTPEDWTTPNLSSCRPTNNNHVPCKLNAIVPSNYRTTSRKKLLSQSNGIADGETESVVWKRNTCNEWMTNSCGGTQSGFRQTRVCVTVSPALSCCEFKVQTHFVGFPVGSLCFVGSFVIKAMEHLTSTFQPVIACVLWLSVFLRGEGYHVGRPCIAWCWT